jgi:hypothetical protein
VIENLSKEKKLNIPVILLKSLKDKSVGVIGKDKESAFLIETRFGIHSFLVDRPLDILILDRGGKVVKLKRGFPPNRLFFWNPKFSFVIEAPEGVIEKLGLEKGNIMRFSL